MVKTDLSKQFDDVIFVLQDLVDVPRDDAQPTAESGSAESGSALSSASPGTPTPAPRPSAASP